MRQTRVAAALVLLILLHSGESAAQRPLPQALADPQVARALAAVDSRRDQTAQWLATIGAVVSPSGQERERAEAVAAEMRRIGLADVTVDASPNVVRRIRGRSGKALVFVSTLDDLATVAAHQRATTATPRIEGDRVIGPGTNTSTTTAALVAAADALMTSGVQPEHDLVFVAVAQEDTGLVGMKALYAQWKDRAGVCGRARRRPQRDLRRHHDSLVEGGRERTGWSLVERRRAERESGHRPRRGPHPSAAATIGR